MKQSPQRWQIALGMSFTQDGIDEFIREFYIAAAENETSPPDLNDDWTFATDEELSYLAQNDDSWLLLDALFIGEEPKDKKKAHPQKLLSIKCYTNSNAAYDANLISSDGQQLALFKHIETLSPSNPLVAVLLDADYVEISRCYAEPPPEINKALLIFRYKEISKKIK